MLHVESCMLQHRHDEAALQHEAQASIVRCHAHNLRHLHDATQHPT
jgi:hypothetical protein